MIRLLIVDAVRLTCSVMTAALKREPDLQVVGYATTGRQALAQVCHSDVVLLSAVLPDVAPIDLAEAILAMHPAARVLVVGLPDSEELIVQCIEAGVAGYVLDKDSVAGLLANIRAVHRGEALVSPAIAAIMMMHLARLSMVCHTRQLLPP